jgi:hypothetical protein
MPLDPKRVVVNRLPFNGEYPVLKELVKSLDEKEGSELGYYYIDLGKSRVSGTRQILVTRFAENIILWLCDLFKITTKQAIYLEGAFSGLIFEYYMTLYELGIGKSSRYVCLTDDDVINNIDPMLYSEVFCETLDQAEFYFSKVAGVDYIIDVYEEDDRYDETF